MPISDGPRFTRAELLRAAGGGAALLWLGDPTGAAARRIAAAHAATASPLAFHSRPDLHPPAVTVFSATPAPTTDTEGYLVLGPKAARHVQGGPLIVDSTGQPVWFYPLPAGQWATNVRVQEYRGQPVLTWWQGEVTDTGYGVGEGVIVDSSYREIARVRAGNGRSVDLHEFALSPEGTALVTCYPPTVSADLTSIKGPKKGHVLESIIQEIDVGSGRVLREWRSLDHISVSESYAEPWGLCDYLHANSIEVLPDGDLLVSARHTWALYKLDRRSGRVIWRMGGKRSGFDMGPGTRFSWQHDASHPASDTITVFDDGAGQIQTEQHSRGLALQYDATHRTVRLIRSYAHPRPSILAYAMGSTQLLPSGNVIVGWGDVPMLSEFTSEGTLVADSWLPWGQDSYRGVRCPWAGTPTDPPAVVAVPGAAAGTATLYASWNGATAVSAWLLSTGASARALTSAGVVQRTGFETAIPVSSSSGYAAATALDAAGQPLGTSATVKL
jgi:hypothetical protein